LISRCQQGDQGAFKELFDQYHKRVYRIAYGVVRQREDALDIVQEVFIKLFRTIKNFKGKSNFYTYLYRVAMNQAIDYSRKMRKAPFLSLDQEEGFQPADIADRRPDHLASQKQFEADIADRRPDHLASQKQFEERVGRAMGSLPEDQRATLIFREIEGLSYQEIAEAMRCSVGTVMSRLHYGRMKLRESLKEEWKGRGEK